MKRVLFTLVLISGLMGCWHLPKDLNQDDYDVNSLKSTDKTYQLAKIQTIEVIDDKKIEKAFDDNWYLVHNDWIKTFNKNQDSLLKLLEDLMKDDTKDVSSISNKLQSLHIKRIK